ncbi:MAG: hypothetical protein ACLR23_12835 [Clostridia bacterium]
MVQVGEGKTLDLLKRCERRSVPKAPGLRTLKRWNRQPPIMPTIKATSNMRLAQLLWDVVAYLTVGDAHVDNFCHQVRL